MISEFEAYEKVLQDGGTIEIGNLCMNVLTKEPMSGWPLDETVYQVSFYDRNEDFEVSNIYEDLSDAVKMFIEIRDIVSEKTNRGSRIRATRRKYEKIFKYEPSSYGEVGLRKLKRKHA